MDKATPPGQPARPSKAYWLRLLAFGVGALSLALLGLLAGLIWLQFQMFIRPQRLEAVGTPAELNRPYESLRLQAEDGLEIAAWYIEGSRPVGIVLVHGIHANRRAVLPEAGPLAEAGYHLLMLDLRSHGQSEGELVTYGYDEALDVLAGVDYLAGRPDVEQVGVFGTSLGGAAVVRAMRLDERIRAGVVQSSYSSLPAAIEDAFDNLAFLPTWPFKPLLVGLVEWRLGIRAEQVDSSRDLAGMPDRAVLIIHGTRDDLFPVDHARRLYEAAAEPKRLWLVDALSHASPALAQPEEFERRVVGFFEEHLAR